MPSTYTLISSNVLSSSAASVTFSSIPSTYTDLVLRCSIRGTNGAANLTTLMYFNGNSTSTYGSDTIARGNGATATSFRDTSVSGGFYAGEASGGTSTSNTFASSEFYIPNYAGSTNKPVSVDNAQENNATSPVYRQAIAALWSNGTAISSITYVTASSAFEIGSSFYLYGISKS